MTSASPAATGSTVATPPPNRKRWFNPKCWMGMNFPAWAGLLVRNRCAVNPGNWYVAAIDTVVTPCHSLLGGVQSLVYGRGLARTKIERPPLFIIGHWRSGTTLLHELLIRDKQFAYPDTLHCLVPNHFLLSEGILRRYFRWVVPSERAMDKMRLSWENPQEEEFALANLGVPSPYLTIAFPNRGPVYQEYLTLRDITPRQLEKWKASYLGFLRRILYRQPNKRLLLKSPTNTARVRVLAEMFPGAQFVHIKRDPYTVFASTVHLWKSLYTTQGLQKPNFEGLEEHVFETYMTMYRALEEDLPLLKDNQYYELPYEKLTANPLGELEAIYQKLSLGGFEDSRPAFEEYLSGVKGYQTNRYEMSEEMRDQIATRWAEPIARYGYSP
jgi:hypothetical protein